MAIELDYFEYTDDDMAQIAYAIDAAAMGYPITDGDNITYDGVYAYHYFYEGVSEITFPNSGSVDIFLVAGGGGGGTGGGGGAGGYVWYDGYSVDADTYDLTVGDGGGPGTVGEDSTFDDSEITEKLTAWGGGYGGSSAAAGDGGSGGGGGNGEDFGYALNGGEQGYDGGVAEPLGEDTHRGAGGGGGANDVGGDANYDGDNYSGDGGPGIEWYDGEIYAGGGGGTGTQQGAASGFGGDGGGGDGASPYNTNGDNGVDNKGGGGGGSQAGTAGSGGSGIIIIRVKMVDFSPIRCFSEGTIKKQGDYSMKVEVKSGALNKYLQKSL